MDNAKGGGAVNADCAEAVLISMIGPREQVPINNTIVQTVPTASNSHSVTL